MARQGNYTQVIYPAGNIYKMVWISNSDYDNYIADKTPAPTPARIKGDMNGDGKVDKTDANLLKQYWENGGGYIDYGDMNNDGTLNIYDVLKLVELTYDKSESNIQISLNVPALKQTDPSWSGKKINTVTIGAKGCTVTSLAMKYNYHNNANITPVDVVSRLKSNNGLTGNSIVYAGVKKAFGYNNYIVDNKPKLDNAWMKRIYDQLKSNNPVIIGAYKTSDWQHWVIIKGYTGNSTSNFRAVDFQINDPQNNFSNLQQFIDRYSLGLRGIIY